MEELEPKAIEPSSKQEQAGPVYPPVKAVLPAMAAIYLAVFLIAVVSIPILVERCKAFH